jgi:hypothetical protein
MSDMPTTGTARLRRRPGPFQSQPSVDSLAGHLERHGCCRGVEEPRPHVAGKAPRRRLAEERPAPRALHRLFHGVDALGTTISLQVNDSAHARWGPPGPCPLRPPGGNEHSRPLRREFQLAQQCLGEWLRAVAASIR